MDKGSTNIIEVPLYENKSNRPGMGMRRHLTSPPLPIQSEVIMYIVIEWNGIYDNLNISCDMEGNPIMFISENEAEGWAKRNIAFFYKVVKI